MGKTVGKGTTLSVGGATIGAGLLISVGPFPWSKEFDDVTAIDSSVEERNGSLPSNGACRVRMYWDKSDTAQDSLKTAMTESATVAIIITRPDASTETATCEVARFEPEEHSRRGRVVVVCDLMPQGAVTRADGA
jgi:hypothetical protein